MNRSRVLGLLSILALAGCGGRAPYWSTPVGSPTTFNLVPQAGQAGQVGQAGQLALVDAVVNRVVLVTPGADQTLTTTAVPVGTNILNAATSPDGTKLFVVSGGHRAQLGDNRPDEAPSITVIQAGMPAQRYDLPNLTEPLAGLAIDEGGHWAVLYPGTGSNQPFVQNPNELLIVDVSQAPGVVPPAAHTLMSFGGHPQRFTFTEPLFLPIDALQPHPLLIVESDQDLSLLRLDDPTNPAEITVPLTNGSDARLLSPAGVAVYPGSLSSGACIGVRLANDTDVVTLQFVPSVDASGQPIGNGFLPTVNLNDVGGTPSDIAFVNTDSGLRLAALVPTKAKATLIDPGSNLTTDVSLPAAYQSFSVVTNALPAGGGCDTAAQAGGTSAAVPTDVALLWNGATVQGQEGVAFWALGQTGCQPYRSIDTVGVTDAVAQVLNVPKPNQALKVLQTRQTAGFYILNLTNRTAAPLETANDSVALTVSPLGDQVWTFQPGGLDVVGTDFTHELPRSLLIERPVSGVYEVARPNDNPAVVVLHDEGNIGATVYDAVTLDDSTRRLYSGLLLGDVP